MRFRYFLFLMGLGLIVGSDTRPVPLPPRPVKVPEVAAATGRPTPLEERWKQLAGGAAVWRRADVTDPLHLLAFDLVADRVQAGNGEITREQFLALTDRPPAARPASAAPARPTPDESGPVPGAQAEFRRRDRNGDGLLGPDEMDDALRAELDRWDANKDGFIDLDEFKNYLRAKRKREAPRVSKGWPATPGGASLAADLSPKLPPWFREYDRDGDGQVSLSEWRAAGQPVAKFQEMDGNGDGFLTPDEVLGPEEEKEKKEVAKLQPQPDPGNLSALQGEVGKVFAFTVAGAGNGGGVWGSGPYTADSHLAAAAVHAGVLQVGQTGIVKVRIVEPPPSFAGSTANGVTTQPFGQFPGAYQIIK